jgi:hypothetical protein
MSNETIGVFPSHCEYTVQLSFFFLYVLLKFILPLVPRLQHKQFPSQATLSPSLHHNFIVYILYQQWKFFSVIHCHLADNSLTPVIQLLIIPNGFNADILETNNTILYLLFPQVTYAFIHIYIN